MKLKTAAHIPMPWVVWPENGVTLLREGSKTLSIARCVEPGDAAYIKQCINAHQALIDDCRSSMEWFSANGHPIEAAAIKRLLNKAEGK